MVNPNYVLIYTRISDLGQFCPDLCPISVCTGIECLNWVGYVRKFGEKGVQVVLSDSVCWLLCWVQPLTPKNVGVIIRPMPQVVLITMQVKIFTSEVWTDFTAVVMATPTAGGGRH